jgi:O-antigen/teichoic acid export membrane protein
MIQRFRNIFQGDIHFKELLKGSITSFGVKVLGTALGFLATLVTTRYYGADALGVASLVFVILNFANIIGKAGMETAGLRFISEYHSQNKPEKVKEVYIKAVLIILCVSIPVGAILYFIAPYLANNIYHKPYLESFIRSQGFLVPPLALSYLNWECLRALKKVGWYMFYNSVSLYLFITLLMMGFCLYYGSSHVPLDLRNEITVNVQNISIFLTFLLSTIAWLSSSNFFKVKTEITLSYKILLNVAFPMLLAGSIFFIQNWMATLILGKYGTDKDVGVFNAVTKVASISSIFLYAINSISAPKFTELFSKNDLPGLQKFVTKSTMMIFITSLPVLFIFCLCPGYILSYFGGEFRAGSTSLIIMTIGQFLSMMSGSVGYLLVMTGFQRVYQNIITFTSIINLVLCFILIPPYGILGAAISNAVTVALWNFIAVAAIKKKLNIITVYFPGINYLRRLNS